MATQIQLRRGTASAWTTANPILAIGEMGLETDTGKFKVGNGTSAWSSLTYSSGVTGPTGPQGSQGVTGPQGAASTVQGPQGAQGAQGPQGILGTQGVQGAVGATGPQGTQGQQGLQGNQGSQGVQGSVGPQGAVGTQGVQGAVGSQGAVGAQGSAGVQGAVGSQGAVGAQGAVGSQGSQGAQGAAGPQGASGVQGAQGNQGAVGAQGFQGSVGSQGSQGPQGSQGFQGFQGATGPQGSTTVGTAIDVTAASSTANPLIVRGAASQTGDLLQIRTNTGAVITSISGSGFVRVNGNTGNEISLNADGSGAKFLFGTTTNSSQYGELGAFNVALSMYSKNMPTRFVRDNDGPVTQVRGMATQTANLQEWQNSSGTVLAYVNSAGRFVSTQSSADDDQVVLAIQVFS